MPRQLSPSSISGLYLPSKCERRTWLKAAGIEGLPRSAFDEYVIEQGTDHEDRVLERLRDQFPAVVDLGGRDNPDCETETRAAIEARDGSLLYQAGIRTTAVIGGEEVSILGYLDFLMPEGDGWVIGDAKLAKTIYTEKSQTPKSDKVYIHLQLQLYAWLLREVFGIEATELRVYTGGNTVELVEDDGGAKALADLERFLMIESLQEEPFEAVGWTKCGGGSCAYRERCWPRAVEAKELGTVPVIRVKPASDLHDEGIDSYSTLLEDFDEESLTELKLDISANRRGVAAARKWARKVSEEVRALSTGKPVRRREENGSLVPLPPEVWSDENYAMFDLEGTPPESDLPTQIYMWGMQVFGSSPGPFTAAIAPFEEGSDEIGWRDFLAKARAILDEHPGIRFVHWHHYEKDRLNDYLKRYGDDEHGTCAEVIDQLLDLLPITKDVVALPTHSYSLKIVEKFLGFARQEEDVTKGDESIVAYAHARDSGDPEIQRATIESIRAYNEEDLAATWHVQRWLVDQFADQRD